MFGFGRPSPSVYGKANEGHWFLFSGAIQVGFQGGRKPTLARSLRGCPCFYSTEAIRSFRSIGLISRSEVCPDKTSRRATTATACIATNHTKRDHNYLMRDYGSNVKKWRTRIVWLDHRLCWQEQGGRVMKTGHGSGNPSASWKERTSCHGEWQRSSARLRRRARKKNGRN